MAFLLTVQKALNLLFIQHYFNINLQPTVYLTEPVHYSIIKYIPDTTVIQSKLAKGKAGLMLIFNLPTCMQTNKNQQKGK